jgi:hypothetical protein
LLSGQAHRRPRTGCRVVRSKRDGALSHWAQSAESGHEVGGSLELS